METHSCGNRLATHYFETHVTIEPIFDERLEQAKDVAAAHGFKVASLLMKKRADDTEQRSLYDTFMTAHGKDLGKQKAGIVSLITDLTALGFKVWRYKIEDIVLDSRINDVMGLLTPSKEVAEVCA